MKKLLSLCLILPTFLFANPHLKELMIVNKQWVKNPDGVALTKTLVALPDENLITCHLMLVEQILRERPTNHLSLTQKKNRFNYLDILKRYRQTGKVPTNDYAPGRFPIFIDRKGVHCAVGYLLKQGGFEYLAQKIISYHQFDYIHQIRVRELIEWQIESGFTIDELAWIQPTYPEDYAGTALPFGPGLKGNVKEIKTSTGKFSFIAGGQYKIEGDTNNVLLAGWDGFKWMPIIKGNGIINKIEVNGNVITSYGGAITFGNLTSVEILETDLQNEPFTHKLIGDMDGEVTDIEMYNSKKYICGKFTGGLAVWENNLWAIKSSPTLNQPNSLRSYKGKLYLTGFEISKYSYNLVSYDGIKFADASLLPKQPHFLYVFSNKLFIGLKVDGITDTFLYCYDGTKISLFDSLPFLYGLEVNNMASYDSKLLIMGRIGQCVGNFQNDTCGYGLVLYDSKFPNTINPIITFGYGSSLRINAAMYLSSERFVVAGNFLRYNKYNGPAKGTREPLFGVAIVYEDRTLLSTSNPTKSVNKRPYPNPTINIVTFPANGHLLDMTGKQVMKILEGINDLSNLSLGVYIFSSESGNFRITKQ